MSGRHWLGSLLSGHLPSQTFVLSRAEEEVEKEEESSGELGGWLPRPRAAQARCRRAAIRLLEGLYGIVQPAVWRCMAPSVSVWHTAKQWSAAGWCRGARHQWWGLLLRSRLFLSRPLQPALARTAANTAHIAAQINHLLHPSPLSFRGN